ncbi:type II secretion system protein GspM [Desulforegula conservatrix]|uniref:type II secretion system protein GspM n=1 Tax=Desulforegula conservatrix TaxID=153026 RepID=UPI00041B0E20|nr:type II secretion system protein GspM [Desulforegula conservatrix]
MTAFWTRLAKREKYAVSAAAGAFLIFIFWVAIISPFLSHREKTAKAIKAKSGIVREMRELQEKYRTLSVKGNQAPITGESIFSFVEKTARETGLKESLASINPSEISDPQTGKKKSRVDVRFQSIDANQLVLFLHKIETSGQGVIENITVTRSTGEKAFLNTNMLIVSN